MTVSRLIGPKRSDERFGGMGRTREMGGGEEPMTFLGARVTVTFLRHSYSKCFKLSFELLLILKFCAHSAPKKYRVFELLTTFLPLRWMG